MRFMPRKIFSEQCSCRFPQRIADRNFTLVRDVLTFVMNVAAICKNMSDVFRRSTAIGRNGVISYLAS